MDVQEIKHSISTYFAGHNMLSQRLSQVYILYRSLQKNGEHPELIMGHLVNHTLSLYYIHYWVVLDGNIHDIIGESYNKVAHTLNKEVELVTRLSIHVLDAYINMDSLFLEEKRMSGFRDCVNGKFADNLIKTTTTSVYDKIMTLYNNLAK
jgi:hypothetical protein